MLGGRGRLLIENREEASCVTEAEASAREALPKGLFPGAALMAGAFRQCLLRRRVLSHLWVLIPDH